MRSACLLVEQAKSAGAHVAVSTELAITGYPPRDLLMSPDFVQAAFDKTQACSPAIPTLIGTPVPGTDREMAPANGVVAVGEGLRGKVVAHKQLLPTYDVFDEARYFRPAPARAWSGVRAGWIWASPCAKTHGRPLA